MLDKNNKLQITLNIDPNVIIQKVSELKTKHKFTNYFFKKYFNESAIKMMIGDAINPFLANTVNEVSDFINIAYMIDKENKYITFEIIEFFNHKLIFNDENERNIWLSKLENIEKITFENIINDLKELKIEDGIVKITELYSVKSIDSLIDEKKEIPKTNEDLGKLEDEVLIHLFGINGPVVKKNLYLESNEE